MAEFAKLGFTCVPLEQGGMVAYAGMRGTEAVVATRGTSLTNPSAVLADLKVESTCVTIVPDTDDKVEVDAGFWDATQSLHGKVSAFLDAARPAGVTFVGHSLGAAISILLALRRTKTFVDSHLGYWGMSAKPLDAVTVVAFAPPRVGRGINKYFHFALVAFANQEDPVPSLPWQYERIAATVLKPSSFVQKCIASTAAFLRRHGCALAVVVDALTIGAHRMEVYEERLAATGWVAGDACTPGPRT